MKFNREIITGYFWVLPVLSFIAVLIVYPFGMALLLSLSSKVLGGEIHFVGFQNFTSLMRSNIFRTALSNSFFYTFCSVGIEVILGTMMALTLNKTFKARNLLRGLFLLPWIIPTAISGLAWIWLFDELFGAVNWLLLASGIINRKVAWFAYGNSARFVVIMCEAWKGVPFFGVIILAGLQSIPQELYEAAEIDGAGNVCKFFSITLPLLINVMLIALLLSITWTFAAFETVWVMTKGGPINSTHLLGTLAFLTGIVNGRLGKGAAISLCVFPMLAVMAFFQLRIIRKRSL